MSTSNETKTQKPPRTPERVTLFNDDIDWLVSLVDDDHNHHDDWGEVTKEYLDKIFRIKTQLLANRPRR